VFVIEALSFDAPSTKRLGQLLASLGVADKKVLILTDGVKPNVYLSGRNYTTAHVMNYADASTYEILWSDVVLIEAGALGRQSDQSTEV
jgi:large subunit ribosomal protein L4